MNAPKFVRAVRIDPERKVVEDVTIQDRGDYGLQDIRGLVGTDDLGHMTLTRHACGWHDDLGLMRGPWDTLHFFRATWYPTALVGVHVLVGVRWEVGEEGFQEDVLADLPYTVKEIAGRVKWIRPETVIVPAPTINGEPIGGDKDGNWTYKDQPK